MDRARYKVAEGCSFFDGMRMHEAGDEVEYDHDPGENLEPVNGEARTRKKRLARAAAGEVKVEGAPDVQTS